MTLDPNSSSANRFIEGTAAPKTSSSRSSTLVPTSDRKYSVSVSVSAEMSADISVSVSVSAIFKVSVSAEISVHIPAEVSVIEYVKSQNVCTLLILK